MNLIIPEEVLKDKKLSSSEKIIIAILLVNPKMKIKDIAEICGMTVANVKYLKKQLKKKGLLNKKKFTSVFFDKYKIDPKSIKDYTFCPKKYNILSFLDQKSIKDYTFCQKKDSILPFLEPKSIKDYTFLPLDTAPPCDSPCSVFDNLNNNKQVTSNTSNTCELVNKKEKKKEKKKKTNIYLKSCSKEKEKKEKKKKETDENERAVNEAVRELLRYFDKVYKYIFDLGYYCEFKIEFDLLRQDYKRYYKEKQDVEGTTRLFKRLIDCYFTLVEYDVKHNKDVNPTIRDFHRKLSQCIIQYKQNDYNNYEYLIEQENKKKQQETSSNTLSFDKEDTKNQDLPRVGYVSNGFRHISEIIKGH
jgi:DNA-binding Lrp family transcriptional regulator